MDAKALRFLGTAYLILHGQAMVEDTAEETRTAPVGKQASPLTIRVLLAEDTEVVRKAITRILNADPEIEVVAEAVELGQAIQLANQLQPEVVVMDLHMGSEGDVMPWQVKSSFAHTRLLTICVWTDSESQDLAKSFGAAELLSKEKLAVELIPKIKQQARR